MAAQLNFAKMKKKHLNVTLPDETVLMISTPKKKTLKQLVLISENLDSMSEDEIDEDVIDDLYDICAIVMSNNKTRTVITKEQLEDMLDIEDIFTFFNSYMSFIGELASQKN